MQDHDYDRDLVWIARSASAVQCWVEAVGYKGYEPFDGLTSPVRRLLRGNLLAERILQQVVRQSPINLRPVLGIKPLESTKGRGMMASGYLLLHKATADPVYRQRAVMCLHWLEKNKSPKFEKHSWANFFDFASRAGVYRQHDSIVVWTSMIVQAFVEAFEQFGDARFLEVAQSACEWILALPRERTKTGECISYYAHEQSSVHNANMLGAAALARTAMHVRDRRYTDAARGAVQYTCARMREDGSWWYGEDPMFRWIDNFHTAYNLDCLKSYIDSTGDSEFVPQLQRGFGFFKRTFFESSGRPKYYHNRAYPIDIQCASQAIDTFAYFAHDDPESLSLGVKVARWTVANMQDRRGFFHYRHYPGGIRARTPMLHWGQATMFRALAHLSLRLTTSANQRIRDLSREPAEAAFK
jgi:hypothetical protein